MAEDFDIEAMLEAPYRKEEDSSHNSHSDSHREKDRDRRKRSRSRDREKEKKSSRRDRDREKDRRGDREDRDHKRSRDRSKERHKSRDRERRRSRERTRRSRSRSRERHPREPFGRGGRFRGGEPWRRGGRSMSRSPVREREPLEILTPEERDARTVFCMQLSARIRPRDLEEFFSSVGKVRDVRIITDNKTRRSKGISYVEFASPDSVPLAIGLTNQRLLGVPIIVQPSQAEKNRIGNAMETSSKGMTGPMRLYVGSLHFNITEDMLRGIFEPFGKIEHINLVMDNETGRSKGFGFVTFHNAEDAKKALEQLNGFELAGRPMKVGHVTERQGEIQGTSLLDSDEMDRAGIDLGATGRLQLMAKLAEGTGFEIPQVAANALNMNPAAQPTSAPPIATQCFMLSNMFDPTSEPTANWENEIRDDVIEECNKHGGVLHIYVDKASPQGNVYVKCPSIASAVASVQSLHGRWFAGKVITAAYVPLPNYHSLFPDAARAVQLLLPSSQMLQGANMLGLGGLAMPGIGFAG